MPVVQGFEEARRVVHVAAGIEHVPNGAEFSAVIEVIDLHAADVDQPRAAPARFLEARQGLRGRSREMGLALDIQRERAERALAARFRQPHRIENAFGNAVSAGRGLDLPFTGSAAARKRLRCKRGQGERRQRRACRQGLAAFHSSVHS